MNLAEKLKQIFINAKKAKESSEHAELFKDMDTDMIALAGHFKEDCVITKNGHICKAVSFNVPHNESIGNELEIKEKIQEAIDIIDKKYSNLIFYAYTYRNAENIFDDIKFYANNPLQENFIDYAVGKHSLINQNGVVFTVFVFAKGMKLSPVLYASQALLLKKHREFLDQQYVHLSKVCADFIDCVKQLHPKILGMYEKEGKIYSEIVNLVNYITNLVFEEIELSHADIGSLVSCNKKYLIENSIIAIERNGDHNQCRYASLLSVKSAEDISINLVKSLMSISPDIVVKEFFASAENELMQSYYEDYIKIAQISDDENKIAIANKFDNKNERDFFAHNVCLMVSGSTIQDLEILIVKIVAFLSARGILFVREDFKAPQEYFACIPGNLDFLTRITTTQRRQVPAIALSRYYEVNDFKDHQICGLFQTLQSNPYFIFSPKTSINFGIVRSSAKVDDVLMKYIYTNLNLFNTIEETSLILCKEKHSHGIFEILQGAKQHYISKQLELNDCTINLLRPYSMQNKHSQELAEVLHEVLISFQDGQGSHDFHKFNSYWTESVVSVKSSSTSLSDVVESNPTSEFLDVFKNLHGIGKYGHVVDNGYDIFSKRYDKVIYYEEKERPEIILLTFIHTILSYIDRDLKTKLSKKYLIVLEDAFTLLTHSAIRPHLPKIFNVCHECNINLVLTGEVPKDVPVSTLKTALSGIDEFLFYPNSNVPYFYADLFGMKKTEMEIFRAMDDNSGKIIHKTSAKLEAITMIAQHSPKLQKALGSSIKNYLDALKLHQLRHIDFKNVFDFF